MAERGGPMIKLGQNVTKSNWGFWSSTNFHASLSALSLLIPYTKSVEALARQRDVEGERVGWYDERRWGVEEERNLCQER